jgi:FAD/FMN-containing dehydrogenase
MIVKTRIQTLQELRAGFSGELIRAGDAGYDAARQVWNAAFDRRPTLITRPRTPEDVVAAVRFARSAGLPVAVRSGGHDPAGHGTADAALVVDLSLMRSVEIEADRSVGWAEPGATAGQYSQAGQPYGLATSFGDTGSVGLGGLTLGGGIGFLVRKHGLTIDSLLSAELVTAEGERLVTSEHEHPELFWALRGGGGNFGIATRFQYRLQPVGMILGGALILPATIQALRGFVEVAAAAPEELTMIGNLMFAPPAPFVPSEQHGKLVFAILACYTGDPGKGHRVLGPLRSLATPIVDALAPMPYPALYQFTAAASQRVAGSHRTAFVDQLDDRLLEGFLDHMQGALSPLAIDQIRILGGAMARVPDDATAFAHRQRKAMVTSMTYWTRPDESERHRAWIDSWHEQVRPLAHGAYVNFLEDEGQARIREAYPPQTYARLAAVKRQWDPDNVFRLNHNIDPAV